jgi:K+-sensing histidine kinase KdpD
MTASPTRPGFWLTNRIANPVLRRLLRGRLGARLGRRLAVLRYRGRRTGDSHELIVQYAREGDVVSIVPGQAERKRWWRNMTEPWPVELWLAGVHVPGTARVVRDADDHEATATALAAYRRVFPKAAEASLVVRVELAPTASADSDGQASGIGRRQTGRT